jgi:hypothetical protein
MFSMLTLCCARYVETFARPLLIVTDDGYDGGARWGHPATVAKRSPVGNWLQENSERYWGGRARASIAACAPRKELRLSRSDRASRGDRRCVRGADRSAHSRPPAAMRRQAPESGADVIRIDAKTGEIVFERERPIGIGAPDPGVDFVDVAAMLGVRRFEPALERDECFLEHSEHQTVAGARGHFGRALIGYERKICCC